jgi:hypothetical protein
MANLTLSIDDDLLKRARLHALEQDTSVNALVRAYLQDLAGADARHDAVSELLSLAAKSDSGSGPAGRTWTRDDLYGRG